MHRRTPSGHDAAFGLSFATSLLPQSDAIRPRRVRLATLLLALVLLPRPTHAGWFKEPCPKDPDGHCIEEPCEPFLEEIRSLASYRRLADDPGCPGHAQASALADMHQGSVDRSKAKMSTRCIRQAAALMRPAASIDVLRSYEANGNAVVLVRYTNNSQHSLTEATITCSALHGKEVVATGTGVATGPIADGASRELPVRIDLGGAAFECAACDLGPER
jgi:hypothetical protein